MFYPSNSSRQRLTLTYDQHYTQCILYVTVRDLDEPRVFGIQRSVDLVETNRIDITDLTPPELRARVLLLEDALHELVKTCKVEPLTKLHE